MTKQVIGVYSTELEAAEIVESLKKEGYTTEEISVIAKHIETPDAVTQEIKPSTRDGAIAGAATGGAIGMAGVLVGLSTVVIPGFGAVLAAGPILTTIGGAVIGAGTDAGGLKHALLELGVPDDDAEQFADDVQNGKVLVLVDAKK